MEDNIVIPDTSLLIKITNINNPYFIRIYEVKNYVQKSQIINKKLLSYMNKEKLNLQNDNKPNLGDIVIVCNDIKQDFDLPSWFCRGIVGHFDSSTMRYNILLVDHGISVKLLRDEFIIVPHNFIPDTYLTSVIGLYNIIPTTIKKCDSSNEYVQFVTGKWSANAIQYTKELITISNAIYFDYIACDKNGKYYGELYLDINDEVIRLSEDLVENGYATYLEGNLLRLIEEPYYKCEKKVTDNFITYYIENSYSYNLLDHKDHIKNAVGYHIEQNIEQNRTKYKERCSSRRKENNIWQALVYSEIKCQNLDFVVDTQFPAKIHKAWDLLVKSNKPKKIQSYMWPAIKEKLNVVAIGTENSGKTFGYTFAITGLLASQDVLPRGNRPSALILCASSSEVLRVHSLCTEFLQSYCNINSVAAFNGKAYRSLVAEIYNGCQILISTPPFLAQFMKMYKKMINLDNLSYLILDNADIILDKYSNSLTELFYKHKVISKIVVQSNESFSLQIILAAKHFTPSVKVFVQKFMSYPYICISSFIEAVIFKSIRPKMYLINSKLKNQKILDLLENEYKLKTMIICTTIDEAEELYTFLSKYKKTLLTHEKQDRFKIEAVKEVWKTSVSGFYSILISTDEVLSDLNITDVDWLIHYSVSLDKKTKFNFRFSTLIHCLQMETSNCKVSIFLNENDDIQFLSIINTMQQMGVVLSDDMSLYIERISMSLDKNKKKYPICDKVKSLGFCPNKNTCAFRHCIFPDIDKPITGIQAGDKVKLILTYIHDAGHFSARIIEHVKANTSESTVFSKDEYVKITSKLQKFYGDINNRRRSSVVDVGSIYGLEDFIESFKRVQVLQIKDNKRNHFESIKLADVRCIDTGYVLHNIKVDKLLWLPEEFSKVPTNIVEVFLFGITPCDKEYEWNNHTNNVVHNWIADNINECSYVVGVVQLHLGNIIWTNTLEIGTKTIGQAEIIGCCLKTELIDNHHAAVNKEQMENILALYKKSKLL